MYQSPIRLAGFTGIITDKKELLLARKKLLAELELSGGTTLSINGHSLSRQDINTLFDELADDNQRRMHEAIFQQPTLLHFLETGNITDADSIAFNGVDPEFRQHFSPIAAQAIQVLLQQVLRDEAPGTHYQSVQHLANNLLPADADLAFQPAFRYYTLRSRTLEELLEQEKEGGSIALEEGIDWITGSRITLLNALPDMFSDLRYKIARDLNNLSVALEANQKVKRAYLVIEQAARIQTTAELMELIRENHAIYRRILNERASPIKNFPKKKPGGSTRKALRIVAFVVIGLLLLNKIIKRMERSATRESTIVKPVDNYPMDEEQQFNNQAFIALKKSLAGWPSSDSPKITPVYARITLPCATCGDGFKAVWSTFFHNKERQTDTGNRGQILLANKLQNMDVFALINVDSRYFTSVYLKPGQTQPFLYSGDAGIGVSFYIGGNWNGNAWHEALMPHPAEAPDRSYLIQGSFMNVPKEQDYLKPEYDVFLRTDIKGKDYRDTIEVAPGKNQEIQLLLGLDERD